MTIKILDFEELDTAISYIKELDSESDFIYRGHESSNYRLETTYKRILNTSTSAKHWDIQEMLGHFRVGLVKNDLPIIESDDDFDWFELARHHGVPLPCLDFTYSPYVALFFAFNRITGITDGSDDYVSIYALDIRRLAMMYAQFHARVIDGINLDDSGTQEVSDYSWDFLSPDMDKLFNDGFDTRLQFIPSPSSFNQRMHRQQGAFLYDNFNYDELGFSDLEDFIEKQEEIKDYKKEKDGEEQPVTLYKINIHKNQSSEAFKELELMGITCGRLYGAADGVANDVINAHYYNTRSSYLRDVKFSEKYPEEPF